MTWTYAFQDGEFDWSAQKQKLFVETFYWGFVVGQLPAALLSNHFGGKRIFGFFILASSLSTLLIPLGSRTHYFVLLLLRFIGGLGASAGFPAMTTFWGKWAPPLERSKLASISYAGSLTGTLLLYPTVGLMCEYGFDGGWPSIFYTIGGFGVIWSVSWLILVSETPIEHYRISKDERRYIVLSLQGQNNKVEVPWVAVLTSLPFLCTLICHFTYEWIVMIFNTIIPKYMTEILKLDIRANDLFALSPYLGLWFLAMVSGAWSDRLIARGVLSTTATRKVMQFIGALVPSGAAIAVGFLDCTRWQAAVAVLALGLSFGGIQFSGFLVCHLDLAPKYAGVMIGIANTVGNLAQFAMPFLVAIITPDRTHEQWQTLFFITASICLFSMIIFVLCGSGELQSWAADPVTEESNHSDLLRLDVESNPLIKLPKRQVSQLDASGNDSKQENKRHSQGGGRDVEDPSSKPKTSRKGSEKANRDRISKSASETNTLAVKDKANPVQRSKSKESRKSNDESTTSKKRRVSKHESSPDGYESLSESHV
ncbi:hypothetical protein CAPTEDRAFT_172198 [Capitella teleta]|uniref:Major facilitator superfamily (MFS) profile domain-containing protein n=1 Tax=Capitella teleta TaxID=283909 RepID=X1ZCN1_CAPTE|nr:hypothetical protein CAPTEDRAFT_172198 [Capitella teleta]|eukprot:ELT88380.1 hypothetical protein CAPTEDRAFT_172198 [Capitella teleta]